MKSGENEVSAFVSTSSREIRLRFPYGESRYDLDKTAAAGLAKALAPYAAKRPKGK